MTRLKTMYVMESESGEKCAFEWDMFEVIHQYVTDVEFERARCAAMQEYLATHKNEHGLEDIVEGRLLEPDDMEQGEWWKRGEKPFGDAT